MALTGCLTEISLPELLRFLEQGRKTGLLTLRCPLLSDTRQRQGDKIWLYQGRIVAASAGGIYPSLLSVICRQEWITEQEATKLAEFYPIYTPMGQYLTRQGAITEQQLELLFKAKVLQPVYTLFQLPDAEFEFDSKVTLPWSEIIGLTLPTTDIILHGLRRLPDWSSLKDNLPAPTAALLTAGKRRLTVQLDAREWLIWEFANGTVSLQMIAQQTRLPLQKVQQIAYRLIVVGFAVPVPLMTSLWDLCEP